MGDRESPDFLGCSFCGKGQSEVFKLITGPQVFICDECVSLCHEIIKQELKEEGGVEADDEAESGHESGSDLDGEDSGLDEKKVTIDMSRDEALVLFEWIGRFNKAENRSFEDKAEQIVLWDIEAALEPILFSEASASNYDELLDGARDSRSWSVRIATY